MKSALLHKRAFTGYPNEVELLEASGDRLFEVDSLRQPGQRMLVALAEDGTVDYPVYEPAKKKVKWKLDDRFGKKFKSEVKKHMEAEVEKAETPKEEQEAVNSPALRTAKLAKMGKCTECGEERSLNRDRICHECQQKEWEAQDEKTAATTKYVPLTCEIRDDMGAPESVGHVYSTAEAVLWFREHGVPFDQVVSKDDGERTTFTFTKSAATGGQRLIEQVIGSGLFNSSEEEHYSKRGCEYCNGGAGSVMDVKGYRNLEEAKKGEGNLIEFELCGNCLNQLYYGEEGEYMGQRYQRPMRASKTAGWDEIRPGDRVTIRIPAGMGRNGQEWAEKSGRVVMRSSQGGWVLNMGGPHGSPGVASPENFLSVQHRKQAASVHELKPLVDKLRNADIRDVFGDGMRLIQVAKQVGASDLKRACEHYLATLEKIVSAGGQIPRRKQRAADDAWKRLEAAYVHFVR
jgi:hypothetical protein